MRLLSKAILLGTSWPHRYPPEAETPKQITDRTLGQLDPVALLDDARQVDPPPAHHALLGQIRPLPHQFRHFSFLLCGEPRLRPRSGAVV